MNSETVQEAEHHFCVMLGTEHIQWIAQEKRRETREAGGLRLLSRMRVPWLDTGIVRLDKTLARSTDNNTIGAVRWTVLSLKFTSLHKPFGDLVQTTAKEGILALGILKTRFNMV